MLLMPWFVAQHNNEMLKNTRVDLLCFFNSSAHIFFISEQIFLGKERFLQLQAQAALKEKCQMVQDLIKIARISNTGKHLSFSP